MGYSRALEFIGMMAITTEFPGGPQKWWETDKLDANQLPWDMEEDYGCAYISLLKLPLQLHFSQETFGWDID